MMPFVCLISPSYNRDMVRNVSVAVQQIRKREYAYVTACICAECNTIYKRKTKPFCKQIQIAQSKNDIGLLIACNIIRNKVIIPQILFGRF